LHIQTYYYSYFIESQAAHFSNDFRLLRANGIRLIFVMYFDFRILEYVVIEKGVFTH